MAAWHSIPLEVAYGVLRWIAFFSCSCSFYPQVILDYSRKSVVGLNFDFLVLNLTKHSSYRIYNAALYLSPVIQKQYREKYGFDEEVVFFDLLFIIQHDVLYRSRDVKHLPEVDETATVTTPLLKPNDAAQASNF